MSIADVTTGVAAVEKVKLHAPLVSSAQIESRRLAVIMMTPCRPVIEFLRAANSGTYSYDGRDMTHLRLEPSVAIQLTVQATVLAVWPVCDDSRSKRTEVEERAAVKPQPTTVTVVPPASEPKDGLTDMTRKQESSFHPPLGTALLASRAAKPRLATATVGFNCCCGIGGVRVRFKMHENTVEFKCTEAPLSSHTRLLSMTETLLRKPSTTTDESMLLIVKLMVPVTADETAVGDMSITNGVADTS